jgi:hypothetical protein
MEILLIACLLAYTAGAQSEQSKLGLSPAQRDIMREKTRHEKAVQKIADKHREATVPAPSSVSPWKEAPASSPTATPETFWSGYRTRRPSRPPLGHRAGTWAGSGVSWAQNTGRDAWQAYRKRRKDAGHDDPGPVLVPLPPAHPPVVPPIPKEAPTVHEKPDPAAGPGPPELAAEESGDTDWASAYAWTDEDEPEAVPAEDSAADTAPESDENEETTPTPPESAPAPAREGVGRMAAEVTYESVLEESDELSIMCEDDVRVYDRIRDRAEREIGRGDALIAAMENTGFGSKVIAWVARCKENYGVIHSEVDDLQANTIAQGEAVVKAKTLLISGQGVYADIAKDMEDVAEREAYISDAVDAEDTQAHTEVYETKAA